MMRTDLEVPQAGSVIFYADYPQLYEITRPTW